MPKNQPYFFKDLSDFFESKNTFVFNLFDVFDTGFVSLQYKNTNQY